MMLAKNQIVLVIIMMSALLLVRGQEDLTYLSQPDELWRKASSAPTQEGNGLYWAPDGSFLVGTFSDGSLRAFDPASGDDAFGTVPDANMFPSGSGGVAFAGYGGTTGAGDPYMTYAVAYNATDPTSAYTIVQWADATGENFRQSVELEGVPAGTPQTTADGQYIMITHNIDQTTGIFSILDLGSSEITIPVIYQYRNSSNPFSPLGVYHNPALGYYDGGENNTNDIFIWAFDTAKDSTAVGTGQLFAFQFPMDPAGNLSVVLMGDSRDFQASTAPVLTNQGVSMYWAATRAEQYCWVGDVATKRQFFNRGRTNKVSLDRGDPAWISARATPSLSFDVNNTEDQVVFGPGASNEIFRLNSNYTELVIHNTSFIVSSRVAVSPDNKVIYYATQDSVVSQLDATTLALNWEFQTPAAVAADITLNSAGTVLYVVDTSGVIVALQVASSSAPTPSPTMPGTSDFPSAVPTSGSGEASPVPTVEGAPSAPSAGGSPTAGGGGSNSTSASPRHSQLSAVFVTAATLVAMLSSWMLLSL